MFCKFGNSFTSLTICLMLASIVLSSVPSVIGYTVDSRGFTKQLIGGGSLNQLYGNDEVSDDRVKSSSSPALDDDVPSEPNSSATQAQLNERVDGQLKNTTECSNDSVKEDFGTACLKKAIQSQVSNVEPNSSNAPNSLSNDANKNAFNKTPRPSVHQTYQYQKSRHFSVKPMMMHKNKKTTPFSSGFKTPAQTARQLYASKGYHYPVKATKSGSFGMNARVVPLSPAKFYTKSSGRNVENKSNGFGPVNKVFFEPRNSVEEKQTSQSKEEDEWSQVDEVSVVSLQPQSENTFADSSIKSATFGQSSGQFDEELELLQSLKRSLGILSAQALNLKQRTVILYREARRRRLYFFDSLISKTHNYICEKQDETRNAIHDIDECIHQIKQHHEISALNNLRRTLYQPRYPNGMRMAKHEPPKIDQKEIDQLMMDALAHAKRMMTIIRELNEALDEFEEQFNLPRFEPNYIDESKEDF